MNATNHVNSPITPIMRTALFFRLVNGSCQSSFPFNHPRLLTVGEGHALIEENEHTHS
jgi:hypothetical protein